MTFKTGVCDHEYCGKPGRRYLVGFRCPDHTPAAIKGIPEPQQPSPYRPQDDLEETA